MTFKVRRYRGSGFYITIGSTRLDYWRPGNWVPLSVRHNPDLHRGWWGAAIISRY